MVTFLAWASLVQVPFSAPIYFCYVAPLAVVAGVALAGHNGALARPAVGVAAAVMLAFALISMNRGYVYNLGVIHQPFAYTTPLDLERASLCVSRDDAVSYRRVIELVSTHIGNGKLVAGPDAPEVYFLAGRFSQSGSLFDFFADQPSADGGLSDMSGLAGASVVVLNHDQQFSIGLSEAPSRQGAADVSEFGTRRGAGSEVAVMGARERLMEHPSIYSAWQAPFAAQKFAPVERWLRNHRVHRVLDVGCGAGTNAGHFSGVEYIGIDVNERYLQAASARFRGRFVQADLTSTDLSSLGTFDMILANSFLHHVTDSDAQRILAQLSPLLAADGTIHILDLVSARS